VVTPDLDPIEPRLEPLIQAIGRAVLAAAALEKVLVIDIISRHAEREGLSEHLDAQLSALESRSAGKLLGTLRELGIPGELAGRIDAVILRRNQVVHHFMEDPDVLRAFATGEGLDEVVERTDRLAADCQSIVNELGGPAFAGVEAALGATVPELIRLLQSAELDGIEDDAVRKQLESIRALDPEDIASVFRRAD
jgi:hypothetical protein